MSPVHDRRFAWFLVAAAASWGFATVVSKSALSAFHPLVLLVVQLTASAAFLGIAVGARRERPANSPTTRKLALLGLLNPGLSYALSVAGLTMISASLSVLLWAAEPLLILLTAAVMLRDRITLPTVTLTLAAAAGVVLIVQHGSSDGLSSGSC